MKLRDRISAALKAWNGGDWVNSDLPGNRGTNYGRSAWVPGTRINWDAVTGEVISCPAVQACLNYIYRNLPQAPPVIREKGAKGDYKLVPDHPVTKLLRRPNPEYDGDTLRNQIAFSLYSNGNAYVVIERTNGGEAAELWWWPHNWIQIPPTTGDTITRYILTDLRGMIKEVPAENVIHLKWGLNPEDPRFGVSPLFSGKRDIYSLQQSSSYRANILRNFGVIGKFIRPKDNETAQLLGPDFDPQRIVDLVDDKSTGDKVGSTVVVDFPADIDYPNVTPQNMAIETMDDRPESSVCALFGLTGQVVGLHVGRLNKTQANALESREQAWEECLMPLNGLIGCQMGYRLIPEFESAPDAIDRYVLDYDYSKVRPLQPDLDKLNTRELEVFKAGITTVGEFCKATLRPEPAPEIRDMRYSDLVMAGGGFDQQNGNGTGQPNQPQGGTQPKKSIDWAERVLNELEELHAESSLVGAGRNGNGAH